MASQMLKYLSDQLWASLPFTDYRPRFFVEAFLEKLRIYTPHFYQARLMNVLSAGHELAENIQFHQASKKDLAYIISSFEELIDAWDRDPIAISVYTDLQPLRDPIMKALRGNDIHASVLLKVEVLCKAIGLRSEQYTTTLIAALREALIGAVELAKMESQTRLIDKLAGLYCTLLLNQGYSPTYLFNRADQFFRISNYAGRDFAAQFDYITGRLRSYQLDFDVYYGIHTSRASSFLAINDDQEFDFSEGLPPALPVPAAVKFAGGIELNVIAHCSVTTTDYVTAAFKAKEALDRFLDAATALELKSELRVTNHAFVTYGSQVLHTELVNIDLLLSFLCSDVSTSFAHTQSSFRKAMVGLSEGAQDQLQRSLRYLRVARNSTSIEQKILNLWIALESLFRHEGAPILGNIQEYVPSLYSVAGISRRIRYLKDLLVANEVAVTPLLAANILPGQKVFDASIPEECIFQMLRNEPAVIELFKSLGLREHLKFKLFYIYRELSDNEAIASRIKQSSQDVTRQLRRIYSIRNRIAHSGHFQGVRPQIVIHLLDYIAICYRAIARTASQAGRKYEISEILAAAKLRTEITVLRVQKGTESIASLAELSQSPLI